MVIEFLLDDIAKEITGKKNVTISLENGTYAEALTALLNQYPALESILINPDQRTLVNGNLLIADDEIIPPHELNTRKPSNGARIRFHAFIVGG